MTTKEKPLSLDRMTPKARQVILLRRIQERRPVKEWQSLLRELAAFDSTRDRLHARAKKRRLLFFVLFVILLIAAFLIIGLAGLAGALSAGVLSLSSLVVAIVFHRRVQSLKKMDLMSDFRSLLLPFFKVLRRDLHKKAKVNLSLNLKGLTTDKIVRKGEIPPGRFKKVTESVYRDRWCSLTARLADESVIRLRIANLVTCQERSWKNPRGKVKSKVKWKKEVLLFGTLFPSPTSLRWQKASVQDRARVDKMKIVKRGGIPGVRIARKYKFKTLNKEPAATIRPKTIVGLLMHLYAMTMPLEKGG